MIKIHILYNFVAGPYGGTNQFLKALRKEFLRLDCHTDNPYEANAILFNAFPFGFENQALRILLKEKSKKNVIIHRIDGPISKYRGRDAYIDHNIYQLNSMFADGTIFQSNYSRKANYQLGLSPNKNETVVLNAPDPEIFNRQARIPFSKNRKIKLIATSWSSNLNKGFTVYQWLDENLDFNRYEMTFIGNSPIAFNNITRLTPLTSQDLASQLKQHDIFIIASKHDPCSNALIEALHCGLPAIAYNSGGHPDIVGRGGKTFDTADEIPALLHDVVQDYPSYQNQIALPDLAAVARSYLNFITEIYRQRATGSYPSSALSSGKVLSFKTKLFQQKLQLLIKNIWHKVFG